MYIPQGLQQLRELARMGEHGVIHIREQLEAGGPYSAWYPTLRPSRPALLVTLHTDSLDTATGHEAIARDWLIDTSRHTARGEALPDIDLAITAYRAESQPEWAKHRPLLETTSGQVGLRDESSGWQLDLRLHVMAKRHLFVTLDTAALAYGLLPEHSKQAWVIAPRLAQRYVDLYLKAHDAYRVRPRYSMNRGLYYWFRLIDCIPAFASAWTHAVFGERVAPQGVEIRRHMQSLYARLMGMMMAHDRIGWLRYTPADNDTRDEMLNQLNYFIVLATGAFDSLAWLAQHRFQINEDKSKITVRATLKAIPFFDKLNAASSALASYLRDPAHQARIALFYEPRDSIQHRLVLKGAHYNTGQYLSDCNVVFLEDAAAEALEAVEHYNPAEDPVWRIWGTQRSADGSGVLLEPYRFTGAALRFIFAFLDGGLERLQLDQWLQQADPSMKAEADAEIARRHRPNFGTPLPWIPGVSVL